MPKQKSYYIGTRYNPQFSKPYYVAYGQLTKKDAKAMEQCSYGSMWLNAFETVESYNERIEELTTNGYTVNKR